METIICSDISVQIPSDLCDDISLLFDIISPDTWNNHLTDENRESLMRYLPDFQENDHEEKTRTLEMFFMDVNFKFGTPLRKFHDWLNKGFFGPKICKIRAAHHKFLYKEYRLRQQHYVQNLLEEVLIRRSKVLEIARSLPPDEIPRIPRLAPSFQNDKKNKYRTSVEFRTKKRYFRELTALKAEIGSTSELSDDDVYPEGPGFSLNKRQRRQLVSLETSMPSDLLPVRGSHSSGSLFLDLELRISPNNNALEITDDQFKRMISNHRARRKRREMSSDLDIRGITLQDVISRAQYQPKRPLQRSVASPLTIEKTKKKIKKEKSMNSTSESVVIKTELLSDLSCSSSSSSSSVSDSDSDGESVKKGIVPSRPNIRKKVISKPTTVKIKTEPGELSSSIISDVKVLLEPKLEIKEEPVDPLDIIESTESYEDRQSTVAIENSTELTAALESIGACIAPELTQETHICFFSLIRDIICSTSDQRMTRNQLESSVRVWQESAISPLNEWYSLLNSWVDNLPSSVNFLCGHLADVQPMDFVPYIEYKSALKVYQWIGAGRDSDGHLEPLAQFWLANRPSMGNEWLEDDNVAVKTEPEDGDVIPPPRCRTSWSVQAATDAEKESYRLQEKIRYEKPHKAYTYRMHGYESVVGPVKGIYTQQTTGPNKARGHSLLVPDRPPYVTILSLVRDAVARLPNGEGTRADICELLKESQYLAPLINSTAENNLNSVVSGALDRLHYENDPSVKYDTSRKLWIYLHRNRNEEEFERMHHLNGPGGGKNKKPAPRRQSRAKAKDNAVAKAPPNVSLEPLTSAVKIEGGQHFKIKTEDIVSLTKPKENINKGIAIQASAASTINSLTTTQSSSLPAKTIASVKLGGLRSGVGVSNVQTIQVSTASGMQTIKVALPPDSQNLTKLTTQGLSKVTGLNRVSSIGQTKSGTSTMKSVTLNQAGLQSALAGVGIIQDSVNNTSLVTNSMQGNKGRSPVVTLTTREAVKLPVQQVPQVVVPARAVVTSSASVTSSCISLSTAQPTTSIITQLSGRCSISRSGSSVINLGTSLFTTPTSNKTTTITSTTSTSTKMIPSLLPSLGGLKVLQTSQSQQITGKGTRTNSPVVVNSSAALQTLMGQKVVMSGGKVLVQGGKVVQAIAGNVGGKQVITGMLPGQQVSVESLLGQGNKIAQGGNVSSVSGGKLSGGNLIQLAGSSAAGTGMQRLTLVSSQGTAVPLNATTQRLVLAAASQGGKLDATGGKVVQTIQTLQPNSDTVSLGTTNYTTTSTPGLTTIASAVTNVHNTQPRFLSVGQQQKTIVQGLSVGGKQSVITSGGIRLVQPSGVTTTLPSGSTAGTATGNLISIGGKQVLLTTKPLASGQQAQLQQMMIANAGNSSSDNKNSYTGGSTAVVVASGAGGQQIVLPASAFQGSQLNLKGLSAFHTLKVLPASQVTTQRGGKPVLARIVTPSSVRPSANVSTSPVTTNTVTLSLPDTGKQ